MAVYRLREQPLSRAQVVTLDDSTTKTEVDLPSKPSPDTLCLLFVSETISAMLNDSTHHKYIYEKAQRARITIMDAAGLFAGPFSLQERAEPGLVMGLNVKRFAAYQSWIDRHLFCRDAPPPPWSYGTR